MGRDETFDCTLTNWDYIYGLCRNVADQVKADEFEPEVVVAIARGGWFTGRCICDFLGLDDLASLKMEHYVGAADNTGEPSIRYPMPEGSVAGKDVLVADDIIDTGRSIRRAEEYIRDRDPGEFRTSTLQLHRDSGVEPDYVGEYLESDDWIVYPWSFIEDMVDLVEGVMERDDAETFGKPAVRRLLRQDHGIERIQMEIAQPDRLEEVLEEMDRRGVIEPAGEGRWRLAG